MVFRCRSLALPRASLHKQSFGLAIARFLFFVAFLDNFIVRNAPQNKNGVCVAHPERLFMRRERDSNPWNAKRSTVFETAPIDHSGISPKFHATTQVAAWVSGDRGIRTPEAFRLNGFQDRRYRPLSHISTAKVQKNDITKPFLTKKI